MGVFGLLRGLAGANYGLVLASTVGIAAAQPFLLNAWTKLPAHWFPLEERATVVGLITLSNLVGTGMGLVITPILVENEVAIATIQLLFGGIAAFSAVLFVLLAREAPPTPPCPPGHDVRSLMVDGLKHALTVKPFWLYLIVSFIGLGIFNGQYHRAMPVVLEDKELQKLWLLEGGMDMLRGFDCRLTAERLSDKIDNVYEQ